MFSEPRNRTISDSVLIRFNNIIDDIESKVGTLFPWSADKFQRVYSDSDLISDRASEIILTGNASQRAKKAYWNLADAGDMCDCCGADLKLKPWSRHYCLCDRCTDTLEGQVRKGWRFREIRLDESDDRVVIEMNFRPNV